MAFSHLVTLTREVTKKYEHDTENFEVYMFDLLQIMEKEIVKMRMLYV